MMLIPKKQEDYDVWHYGTTGKIGDGANAEIYYLQSSLTMKELAEIKLLIDIPGSEKWNIKDLFQRNVDRTRITGPDGLIEYFKDANQVKYFNPITLVLLPIDDQYKIIKDLLPLKVNSNDEFENIPALSLSYENHYKLFLQKDKGNIGKIELNRATCNVVAIDGQHRLTALKELYRVRGVSKDAKGIEHWQIPVVYLILKKKVSEVASDDLIQIIRKIFMYINMKAEKVNDARAIMLNDESIECLCVQEILSAIHENDISNQQNESYPPLYLLDWLGVNKETSLLKDTRYLFSNIELRNWIGEWLIGKDFDPNERKVDITQLHRLELLDIELEFLNNKSLISQIDAKKIRKQFNSLIKIPFLKFLTGLSPINNYISECRAYEKENFSDDAAKIAFSQLRYGYATKEESNKNEIDNFEKAFKDKMLDLKKENLSEFFRQDICLRGFVYAYSELYDIYKGYINRNLDWIEYTDLFLPAFNNVILSGWCEGYDTLDPDKKDMLTHICHNDVGKRINYKPQDVKNAWGLFIIMSVLDFASKNGLFENAIDCKKQTWESINNRLENTLQKGFRDIAKREADQNEWILEERLSYIKTEKEKLANDRIAEFEILWDIGAN